MAHFLQLKKLKTNLLFSLRSLARFERTVSRLANMLGTVASRACADLVIGPSIFTRTALISANRPICSSVGHVILTKHKKNT